VLQNAAYLIIANFPEMKKNTLIMLIALLFAGLSYSQTLEAGSYTSSDGGYTFIVKQDGDVVEITEPNKVNNYKKRQGNVYYHTEPKYAAYYIKIAGADRLYTGKDGGAEYLFVRSGGAGDLASGTDDCPVYEKYSELMSEDPDNTQAWTFCAAAAIAKCTYTAEGAKSYLVPIIQAMKSMMDDGAVCPCKDAIDESLWNAN
jgi:hypothetical protein